MNVLEELPKAFQCEAFKKLKEVSDVSKLSEQERERYEYIRGKYWDAWMELEDSKQEGLEEGLAKGLKKGREEGHFNGLLDAARNLKNMGMTTEQIHTATGLATDMIDGL